MNPILEALLRAAITKTAARELQWRVFSIDSFRVTIGPGRLHSFRGTADCTETGDERPLTTYSVHVVDDQHRIVAESHVTDDSPGEGLILLTDLFNAARKSALRIDAVLDEMLDALRRT